MSNQSGSNLVNKILAAAGMPLIFVLGWIGLQSYQHSDLSSPKSIAEGKQLFSENCAKCHGQEGVGENLEKVAGGMKEPAGYWAPALNGTAHTWHHPPKEIFNTILNGSLAEDSPMKGFGDKLDDQQILKIMSYIKSLWPEKIRRKYESTHIQGM